ncbi:MAG: DUF2069 domain-containing protein [Betaproteobacteria bacterium]|nr:DUF2069 domain-containing protein [Betaproteobacteria bacterium]
MRASYWGAVVSLLALIAVCLAWEVWLAPLRPGGSWLMLKALPLLAPLRGVLAGRRRTYQWASMLILAYVAEGAVRAWSDHGLSAALAVAEAILALAFFASAVTYARLAAARS